jgi:hypothetical protein
MVGVMGAIDQIALIGYISSANIDQYHIWWQRRVIAVTETRINHPVLENNENLDLCQHTLVFLAIARSDIVMQTLFGFNLFQTIIRFGDFAPLALLPHLILVFSYTGTNRYRLSQSYCRTKAQTKS